MELRIACIAAIYDKSLRLESTTTESSGKMVNLATNDVERFLLASAFAPYVIWGPLMLVLILVVGWLVIGSSFAVGISFMAFCLAPLQIKLSKKFGGLRSTVAKATDARVNAISQALQGIRVVKMLGYENIVQKRITALRAKEIAVIMRINWYKVSPTMTVDLIRYTR